MSFSFSLFLPLVFSFPCRRSKGARMPETPCLFGNQTAVFLKCAEIDCALESAKKPRTAGLCGRTAGACDCGPLSCAFIERVNKGRNPPKQGMAGREAPIPKGSVSHCRSRIHRAFSHIAHKRRNVRFKRLRRVHTPPQPITAHTAAHTAKHGGKRGAAPCGAARLYGIALVRRSYTCFSSSVFSIQSSRFCVSSSVLAML